MHQKKFITASGHKIFPVPDFLPAEPKKKRLVDDVITRQNQLIDGLQRMWPLSFLMCNSGKSEKGGDCFVIHLQ
jgi:hypothetical protein